MFPDLWKAAVNLIFYGVTHSYQTQSIGRDGQYHHFEKPWFSNFIMFLGMSFLFFKFEVDILVIIKSRWMLALTIARSRRILSLLIRFCFVFISCFTPSNEENKRPQRSVYYKVLYPAVCDFLASFIMFVGLLWIPVSIWQMIRGSIILFTGLIRQYWLKKPLNKSEWTSLVVIFFSLILVGAASFPSNSLTLRSIFSEDTSSSKPVSAGLKILGMFFVFIAQGIQAFQTVIGSLPFSL